jgi:transposase InsO family protein
MESFFRTLKVEQVYLNEYRDLAEARRRIGVFLEQAYNQQRLHSALGYVPPAEFEAAWHAAQEEKSAPVLRPSALLTRDPVAPAGAVYAQP